MKCPKCGFENLDGASFCIKCGSRIDGKIACPKCGEYIPNEASFCPHCGKPIPHESISKTIEQDALDQKKQQIGKKFNRVSLFVCLAFFIVSVIVLFANYFSRTPNQFETPDFVLYLIEGFQNIGAMSEFDMALTIVRAIIFAFNVFVVIGFSIVGIIKLIRAFKDQSTLSDVYKYLVIVFTSHALTIGLLGATYSPYFYSVSDPLSSYFAFGFMHIAAILLFDCFLHFKKGQVSIFIARLLFAASFLIIILTILAFQQPYLFISIGDQGFIYHFVYVVSEFIDSSMDALAISVVMFAGITLICILLFITFIYSTIIYLSSAYFKGMTTYKRFRIIYYMCTVNLAVIATMIFVSSLTEMILFTRFMNDPNIAVSLGLISVEALTASILLLGVSVASFRIYTNYNRLKTLEQKTSKVD